MCSCHSIHFVLQYPRWTGPLVLLGHFAFGACFLTAQQPFWPHKMQHTVACNQAPTRNGKCWWLCKSSLWGSHVIFCNSVLMLFSCPIMKSLGSWLWLTIYAWRMTWEMLHCSYYYDLATAFDTVYYEKIFTNQELEVVPVNRRDALELLISLLWMNLILTTQTAVFSRFPWS